MEIILGKVKVVKTDALTLLAGLADSSVDLIAVDPPYYKVVAAEWDHQWSSKADFIGWVRSLLVEYQRVLKPGGSLYFFCGPYLAAEMELLVGEYFGVLNHIVWRKPTGRHLGCSKESLTKYFPQTERIIFAESKKKKPFHYESIRAHLADAVRAAGYSNKQVDDVTGVKMAGHWFGRSQFSFPSEAHYEVLKGMAPALRDYDDLRSEFVGIRGQSGRCGRQFSVSKSVPYTDVWDFPVVAYYPGKHPCEKPQGLMDHIIMASSNLSSVVLDTFVGSGTTALSCLRLHRNFVGCEMGDVEFQQAADRLGEQARVL